GRAARRRGLASMSGPFKATAKRQGATLTYAVSVDPWTLAPFMKSVDALKEVATVVRHGGTSAAHFRNILSRGGWALRGAGTQPPPGPPHGAGRLPPAKPAGPAPFLGG